ncbi:MAG: hypothetical protein ACT4NU_09265 [Chromatiales bacterium]
MRERRMDWKSRSLARTLMALLALACGGDRTARAEAAAEYYPVPGHGELRLLVPADWQLKYVYTDDASTAPTFHVTPLDGDGFEMTVSVYWHDGLDQDITSAEALRERVQKAGEEAVKASTDKELEIEAIGGLMRPGFLYDLSDANAADGEFRYLTQGALAVGQLVLVFTVVTNERPSEHREACLRFLTTARQVGAFNPVAVLRRLLIAAPAL